ncbi:MAG: gfo/Idh/MocA family oxidoreductase [Pseudomonadales bacterium]|nr:gfo/Idh/MocA family oxidoreductase [Pseudomonadales bacterium]
MGRRVKQPVEKSRAFRRAKAFAYLEDQDRYLTQRQAPNLNFGFIGCGMMGLEHMRNAHLTGSANVSGIYDPNPTSTRHALEVLAHMSIPTPTSYRSLNEACADPKTDALIIATPNFTHLEVMQVAAKTNKAIFLEKPIATTVSDAIEVCRLAQNHKNIVRVGLQYRYKAIYAEALAEVFDRHTIGEVSSVNMLEHRFPFLDKVEQWNKFNVKTGGTLVEKCCHYFDLMNLFAGGNPELVFATGSQATNFKEFNYANKSADGLDQAQVVVNYQNGVIGGFSLCMFVPGSHEELIVCGDVGRVRASERAELGDKNENLLEVWVGEGGASRVTVPKYPSYIESAGHHGSTFFEHLAFAEDLSSAVSDGPSLEAALLSALVGFAAQASIEEKAAIEIADLLPDDFDMSTFS